MVPTDTRRVTTLAKWPIKNWSTGSGKNTGFGYGEQIRSKISITAN